MTLTDIRQSQDGTEERMVELFFKALLRLGVHAADWEILYGTRPLVSPVYQRRARVFHSPSNPNPGR